MNIAPLESGAGNNGDQPPDAARKVSILLVDDRPDKLMALEAILSDLGENLVLARSGKEALRWLLHHEFAVILLDVNMPGMDGFETAALIRQRKRSEHTPIIFMSASSDTDNHMTRGYSLGAVDYILTPALSDVLKSKVSVFVELYRQTERIRTLNTELERRVVELTETNQQLERFTYSIAHDLRAPLRAMQGFATALADDYQDCALDEAGCEMTGRIVQASLRMDQLIRDLLEYSRVSRAEIPLETINLKPLVISALKQMEQQVQQARAQICTDALDATVIAHPTTLEQIVVNLVENALKFHRKEQPVCVRLGTESANGSVRLYVQDNGIGIDPEYLDRIFGIFERLHPGDIFPGTGIGLAIVRKGAERMGCQVGVESKPDEGSRFWIDLPSPNLPST